MFAVDCPPLLDCSQDFCSWKHGGFHHRGAERRSPNQMLVPTSQGYVAASPHCTSYLARARQSVATAASCSSPCSSSNGRENLAQNRAVNLWTTPLACIVHKFGHLSIRLSWMENKFVINSGYGSGTLRLRRIIPLLLEEKNLKTVCSDSGIKKIRS